MKSHVITESRWLEIRQNIREEHGDSMILVREKMKRELGILPRRQQRWVPKMDGGYHDSEIHIDFYSEQARTWFLLKYE